MAYLPTQAEFMQLQDSARLVRSVFRNYPKLQLCLVIWDREA